MTYPATPGNSAALTDYNDIQSKVSEVLGLSEDGYGVSAISTQPAATGVRITAYQWNSLIDDINLIYQHLGNTSTTTSTLLTGTSVVSAGIANELNGFSEWLATEPDRYTAHPQKFILDSVDTPFLFANTSTRTTTWGISTSTITHGVLATFATPLQAHYYFNLGNYIEWQPFYEPATVALNDLDSEWINWIEWLKSTPGEEYQYSRTEFIGANPYTRTYTSGTLSISIVATRQVDAKNINFNITYSNSDAAVVIVSPTVAGYTINI